MARVSLSPVAPDSGLGATPARRFVNNVLHVPAYAVLAALFILVFRPPSGDAVSNARLAFAALAAALFGALMEVGQAFVPGRYGGLDDAALNALGAALCVAAIILARRRRHRIDPTPLASAPPPKEADERPDPAVHDLPRRATIDS